MVVEIETAQERAETKARTRAVNLHFTKSFFIQISFGFCVSIMGLDNISGLGEFLANFEFLGPTYREALSHSVSPIAAKVIYLVWFFIFLPRDLFLWFKVIPYKQFSNRLNRESNLLSKLLLGTVGTALIFVNFVFFTDFAGDDHFTGRASTGALILTLFAYFPLIESMVLAIVGIILAYTICVFIQCSRFLLIERVLRL